MVQERNVQCVNKRPWLKIDYYDLLKLHSLQKMSSKNFINRKEIDDTKEQQLLKHYYCAYWNIKVNKFGKNVQSNGTVHH